MLAAQGVIPEQNGGRHGQHGRRDRQGPAADRPPNFTEEPLTPSQNGLAGRESFQILRQGHGRCVAVAQVLGHRFQADGFQVPVRVRRQLPRRRRRIGLNLPQHFAAGALEGRTTAQQVVQHGAQGVDIRGGAHLLDSARGLFRGHVRGRAHDLAVLRQLAALAAQFFGQAEIHQHRLAGFGVDHDVGRLDVAVQDAVLVGIRDGANESGQHFRSLACVRTPGLRPFRQRLALDIRHADIRPLADLPDFVDGADIGMPQLGRRTSFAQESLLILVVRPGSRARQFDGHHAVQLRVPGPQDDPHPAAAQDAEELVIRDGVEACGPVRRAWRGLWQRFVRRGNAACRSRLRRRAAAARRRRGVRGCSGLREHGGRGQTRFRRHPVADSRNGVVAGVGNGLPDDGRLQHGTRCTACRTGHESRRQAIGRTELMSATRTAEYHKTAPVKSHVAASLRDSIWVSDRLSYVTSSLPDLLLRLLWQLSLVFTHEAPLESRPLRPRENITDPLLNFAPIAIGQTADGQLHAGGGNRGQQHPHGRRKAESGQAPVLKFIVPRRARDVR